MTDEDLQQHQVTFRERLFSKDCTRARKYVESATTHGVAHVFRGRSKIRRLFWAFIFLGAVVGCLYNIGDRINYLARGPTATTISLKRQRSLPFPAVTVCNLNVARRSHLEENGLEEFVSSVYLVDPDDPTYDCESSTLSLMPASNISSSGMNVRQLDTSFHGVQFEGRHALEDFIAECFFQGRNCNVRESFVPVLTQLGYCYTFNSGRNGRPINYTNGTGPRQGLQLLLNIQQSEYIASLNGDAGVKIAVHPQGEPGQPNVGVAVPPGRNAFIGLQEKRVEDTSSNRRDTCRDNDDTETTFNFLQGKYSTSACLVDCFFTNIAHSCGCVEASVEYPPISSAFRSFPNCTASHICCVIEQYAAAESCDCPTACEYTVYDISTSYSAFPSESVADEFARERNTTTSQISKNYLGVEIYFESLNVEREVTEDAYSVVALLSDIGGQLALFVGVSVISVLEFGMWLLDEVKDRCFGIGDQEIHEWVEAEKRKWKERKRRDSSSVEMKEVTTTKETDV